MRPAGFAAALGVVLCAVPGPAAAAELPRLLDIPLQVSIPVAPVAFRSNGQSHLVYEIQITNLSTTPWTLQQVDVREVLAAADGVVVEIKDGIRENVPQQPPAVPITLETIAGNHIDLDLGGGVFALYAHLQPGSLRVKPGDTVRRGQVLGLLGNSGNSTERVMKNFNDRLDPPGSFTAAQAGFRKP